MPQNMHHSTRTSSVLCLSIVSAGVSNHRSHTAPHILPRPCPPVHHLVAAQSPCLDSINPHSTQSSWEGMRAYVYKERKGQS
jgi:hypothetical protein